MKLIRHDPFGQLDTFWGDTAFPTFDQGMHTDIYEEGNNVIVKVSLPGFKKEQINVTVEDKYVYVVANTTEEKESKNKKYYKHEIRSGSSERMIALPCAVVENKGEATYQDGVLTITAPKAESTKRKQAITVK